MNIVKFCDFNKCISGISIVIEDQNGDLEALNPAETPFPQCKIMQVTHVSFFTDNSSMARDFKLDGDKFLDGRNDGDDRTFWVALSPRDDWCTIIEKAAELSRLSGDRHHTRLEGFSVVEDILIPNFGS